MERLSRDEVSTAFEPVADNLAEIERLLEKATDAPTPFLGEVSSHLTHAGGKRIRPAVTVFSSRLGTGADHNVLKSAAAIELTHMATLYHDDVIDEADLRRGVPSANAKWDNTVAILAGDFLFARSSGMAAEVGGRIPGVLADAIALVVEGQILQLEADFDSSRTFEHYFATITGKTAALFEASSRIGAILGGLDSRTEEVLAEFGRSFGLAFQVADDLLDLTASENELGKPPGTDLRDGVFNLPVIWALEKEEGLRRLIGSSDVDLERILQIVVSTGAFDRSREFARLHVEEALGHLEKVPDVAAKKSLEVLARLVVERIPDPDAPGVGAVAGQR
jgi:heptaprenyl diphosphate synthase